MNTILTIPFFNILIATLYCREESGNLTCYKGIYFFHLSIVIVSLVLVVFLSWSFCILYIDLNPNSKIPFAAP